MTSEQIWKTVLNVAQVLTSHLDLDNILESLIEQVTSIIAGDAGVILLWDIHSGQLVPKHAFGFNMEHLQHVRVRVGEGMAGKTFIRRQSGIFNRTAIVDSMANISLRNREYYTTSLSADKPPLCTICAPLIYKDDCLGVMTIDRYSNTESFTQDDLDVLEAISHHAAIAIVNAELFAAERHNTHQMQQLHDKLRDKNETLNTAIQVHERLTKIALEGRGIEALCESLSTLLGKNVMLFDDMTQSLGFSALGGSGGGHVSSELSGWISTIFSRKSGKFLPLYKKIDGHSLLISPIVANEELLGFIVLWDVDKDRDQLVNMACNLAATVFSLELTKQRMLEETRLRLAGEMLDELVNGQLGTGLLKRLQLMIGGDFDSSYVIAMIQLDGCSSMESEQTYWERRNIHKIIRTHVRALSPDSWFIEKHDTCVVLFSFSKGIHAQQAYRDIRIILQSARHEVDLKGLSITFSTGIGQLVDTLSTVHQSYLDAKMCISYLQFSHSTGKDITYNDLGVTRIFLQNDPTELEHFVQDSIGPILEYDQKHNTNLLGTMATYLESNSRVQTAAKHLNVHVNTLHYRLNKIRDLLGVAEESGYKWLEVHLAIKVFHYLQTGGNL